MKFLLRMRIGVSRVIIFLVAGGLFLTASAQTAAKPQIAPAQSIVNKTSPIALSTLSSGELAVLESHGGISILNPANEQLRRIKDTLGNFVPLDMASGIVNDKESLFITMYWAISAQSLQTNQGVVIQYSLDGRETHKWSLLGHIFGGLAIDVKSKILYLGSALSPEIYSLDIEADKSPTFVTQVAGASRLGALALDVDQHRLFACDVGSGNVYNVDLTRHKSRLLVSGLGDPAALAYDPAQHKLYIADAGKRTVWQVLVDAAAPKADGFFFASQLREPRGLATGQNRTLWIADYSTGTVLQLSPKGQVTGTFRH